MPDHLTLTIDETAEELRLSRSTILKMLRTGELPCVRVGKVRRIRRRDLESLLEMNDAQQTG